MSDEFIAMDLRMAVDILGEVVGEITTEDILDKIFQEFCIGK
jgi:tRNA modification GTPase